MAHTVTFVPSGRGKAQCPASPEYPHGIALTVPGPDQPRCTVELPYPAPECGAYQVRCLECPVEVMVTAAGRADDPVSISLSCLKPPDAVEGQHRSTAKNLANGKAKV